MYKRKYAVLIVLMAAIFVFPCTLFAAEKGEKGDKDAILQELGSFIDKNPNILRTVIFSMGDEYSRENKINEAIALYEKGVKLLPKDEDFLNRLGSLYNQKRDYVKAAEVYKKSLAGKFFPASRSGFRHHQIVKHSMFDTAKKILGAHAAGFPAKAQNAPPFPRHKKQTPGKISNQAPPGAFIQRLGGNLSKICAIIKICITGQQMKKLSRKTAKITQLGNLNS